MLEVVALTYNELAPVLPIGRCLPPEGGTIGRDADNAVVLPDPMRLVSRHHLQVVREPDGSYWLANISDSNAALVNDSPLEPGSRRPLTVGDEVRIGCYLLQIRAPADCEVAAGAASPFREAGQCGVASVDDFGLLSIVGNAAAPAGAPPAAPDAPVAKNEDLFRPSAPALGAEPESLDIDRILDRTKAEGSVGKHDLDLGQAIELSDLNKDGSSLLGEAGWGGSTFERMSADPLTRGAAMDGPSLDPLQLFGAGEKGDCPFGLLAPADGAPERAMESQAINHRAELNSPYRPPAMLEALAAAPGVEPAGSESRSSPAQGSSAMASASTIPEGLELDDLVRDLDLQPTTRREVSPSREPVPSRRPQPGATAPSVRRDASAEALYRAVLEGLGVDGLQDRKGLDEDFMRLIGALLRQSVEGAVRLMTARATVKREVRANVTLIAPERNNPLKFSPDGRVALMYLLGRRYPGFMEAEEAVQEAFADLYDHQVGVLAGMRSALSHVFERFDPETISRNANDHGVIESILAVGRKARLWDAYGRYFENTRDQAIDRFQDFFGAAFVDAYEEASTRELGEQQKERQR